MAFIGKADPAPGSDTLTKVVVGLLALLAVGGTLFCLVYAVWWLIVFWAPA